MRGLKALLHRWPKPGRRGTTKIAVCYSAFALDKGREGPVFLASLKIQSQDVETMGTVDLLSGIAKK